jgi:N-[(2S)-2-amino-2-carboxyethyl]-L-glutamate dehydrogenase
MLYLNEEDLKVTGINWNETINVIENTVKCLARKDYSQPVKPYLRYRNFKNRIIAMPAFVGGDINIAGIKWIASFPDNIKKGIPRAHSIVILNNSDTGQPIAIINTALLSIIRTASVSGLMVRCYDNYKNLEKINVGITGFGPIGQYHLKMITSLIGDKISKIFLYDINDIDTSLIQPEIKDRVTITNCWEDAYLESDIFMTCTVSKAPYIDRHPKAGSLHLNVSLRDYKTDASDWFKGSIIVDDWIEVCRENTDIEMMHIEKGLKEQDTNSIVDVVVGNCLTLYDYKTPILFNPMGMAIFDNSIGNYYYQEALNNQLGIDLK